MQHLDEGMIHAWLDGELPVAEREALEAHIAECAQCAAAVAEARGFVAASTRILTALDSVPSGVLPAATPKSGTVPLASRRRFVASRAWMAAAAVLVLSTVTVIATRPGGDAAQLRVAAASRSAPAEEKPQATEPSVANAPAPVLAPVPMQKTAPVDAPKPVDQNERLKSRLEAERQSTRARSSAGAASPGAATGAMADAAPPARAPEPPAPMPRASLPPATPPAAFGKDLADKRADVLSRTDSASFRTMAANTQGVPITGRVTSDAGAPLASASVMLEGSGIGTITHDDGSFALVVPSARANGKTLSLVARLIGYKAAAVPITPDTAPITHDFVLASNPLALGMVVVTGQGTTSNVEKLGSVTSLDTATADSAAPRLLSSHTIHVADDTVITAVYRVRGVSVSLIDHSRARDEAQRLQVRDAVTELPAKSRKAAAAVNSISWTDSTGHTRTLRGPLTPDQLEQLKQALFGATP